MGSFVFGLVASDTTGQTTMSVTFVVSSDPGPGLDGSYLRQLSLAKGYSAPNTILLPHSTGLSLSFDSGTFTNTNENTAYYALSANNTPLPSWLHFDPSTLSFSGTAPLATSLTELPQGYVIEMTASDVIGFAGAKATFQIVVESHLFLFGSSSHIINATAGSSVNYLGLQSDLFLNGLPVNTSSIEQINADPPSWLSLNTKTLVLSGIPPKDAPSQNFTVNATDVYGDAATTLVSLQTGTNSTETNDANDNGLLALPTTVYTGNGSNFVYDLHKSLRDGSATISVDLGQTWTWLHYDSGSMKLEGSVPHDLKQTSYTVEVKATSGTKTQSQELTIAVTGAVPTSASSAVMGSATGLASGSTDAKSSSGVAIEHDRRWIALAVVLPVLVLISLLAIILCCLCRRRRKRAKWYCESTTSSKNSIVDEGPNPGEKAKGESDTAEMSGALNAGSKRASSRYSKPPTIDIAGLWRYASSNRNSRFRSSKASTDDGNRASKVDSWHRYTMDLNARTASRAMYESEAIVEEQDSLTAKQLPQTPKAAAHLPNSSADMQASPNDCTSLSHRKSSNLSFSSAAFFSSHINGFGHGRAFKSQDSGQAMFGPRGMGRRDGSGPPGYGTVQDSWRSLQVLASAVASSNEGRLFSPYSLGPPSRAIPSTNRDRSTIRVVNQPSFSSGRSTLQTLKSSKAVSQSRQSERDPLQEFHRQRLLMKNSERALFSAERSSRKSSRDPTLPCTPPASDKTRDSNRQSSILIPDMPFTHTPSPSPKARKGAEADPHEHSYSALSSLTSRSGPSQLTQSLQGSSIMEEDRFVDSPGIRLPLTGRHTRKSSLLTDDGDSRWESAASDAASMVSNLSPFCDGPYSTIESVGLSRRLKARLQNLLFSEHIVEYC